MISYDFMEKYNFIGLKSKFGTVKINNNLNGLKILYENLDDNLLWNRNIKIGTMYREAETAYLNKFKGWNTKNYKDWEIQSLKRQSDMLDLISFISGNSKKNDNFYKYLEKNLDIDYYLKWLSLSIITGGYSHILDHNIVFYNDLEIQKFRPITYDPAGLDINQINKPIQFFGNRFNQKILMNPIYFKKILSYLNKILTDPEYELNFNQIINTNFSKFEKARQEYRKINNNKEGLIFSEQNEAHMNKLFLEHLSNVNCKNWITNKDLSLSRIEKNNCLIENSKKINQLYFNERKKFLLNEINKIEFSYNQNKLNKKNYNNKNQNTEIFNFSINLKSLSSHKLNKLIFKINKKQLNLESKKNNLFLCENNRNDINFLEISKCTEGAIVNNDIIFNTKNKNIVYNFDLNLFNHQKKNNFEFSSFDNELLLPKTNIKKFAIYSNYQEEENLDQSTSLIIKKIEIENNITKKITSLDDYIPIKYKYERKIIENSKSFIETIHLKKNLLKEKYSFYYYLLTDQINNIFNFKSYFSRIGYNFDQSLFKKTYLPNNKKIIWGPNENIFINQNTILPPSSTLIINPGTNVFLKNKKNIIFHGVVLANGSSENPIYFGTKDKNTFFGSLIFNHESMDGSKFNHVIIERGSDVFWDNRFYMGALNIYNAALDINNSIFRYNKGDDAVNYKYSKSIVKNSQFVENKFDGLDADFSNIQIINCYFDKNGNDGIDLGSSIAYIENNIIQKSGDKGISVGEESYAYIKNNSILDNLIGIASKDESFLIIEKNLIDKNKTDTSNYIKKKKFGMPKTTLIH